MSETNDFGSQETQQQETGQHEVELGHGTFQAEPGNDGEYGRDDDGNHLGAEPEEQKY